MLAISLFAVANLGFVGVAAADAPTTTECNSLSWSTQQISGETYYEVDRVYRLQYS